MFKKQTTKTAEVSAEIAEIAETTATIAPDVPDAADEAQPTPVETTAPELSALFGWRNRGELQRDFERAIREHDFGTLCVCSVQRVAMGYMALGDALKESAGNVSLWQTRLEFFTANAARLSRAVEERFREDKEQDAARRLRALPGGSQALLAVEEPQTVRSNRHNKLTQARLLLDKRAREIRNLDAELQHHMRQAAAGLVEPMTPAVGGWLRAEHDSASEGAWEDARRLLVRLLGKDADVPE